MSYVHIRGSTFTHTGQAIMLEDGVALGSMLGWTGAAQVQRLDGTLIENLTFAWNDAAQRLMTIAGTTDTSGWPIGVAKLFISMTSPAGQKVNALPTLFTITGGFVNA